MRRVTPAGFWLDGDEASFPNRANEPTDKRIPRLYLPTERADSKPSFLSLPNPSYIIPCVYNFSVAASFVRYRLLTTYDPHNAPSRNSGAQDGAQALSDGCLILPLFLSATRCCCCAACMLRCHIFQVFYL